MIKVARLFEEILEVAQQENHLLLFEKKIFSQFSLGFDTSANRQKKLIIMVQRYLKFIHGKILYNVCGLLPIIIVLLTLRDLHNRNKLQRYVPNWILFKTGVYLQVILYMKICQVKLFQNLIFLIDFYKCKLMEFLLKQYKQ